MSIPDPTRDEALRRLHQRADALETSTAEPVRNAHGDQAVNQAYRIIAELFGGVIVGLALGFGVDWLLNTRPWGIIGGVLLGFAVSIWMAKRTADRLTAQARAEDAARGGPPPSVPDDEDEER